MAESSNSYPQIPTYVLDASVAVKWFLIDEVHTTQAQAKRDDFVNGRVDLVAPELIRHELASAIVKAAKDTGHFVPRDSGIVANMFSEFLATGIRLVDTHSLVHRATALSLGLNCQYYDALYVALAEALEIPFLHADGKLHNTLAPFRVRPSSLPFLDAHQFSELWIEDYQTNN